MSVTKSDILKNIAFSASINQKDAKKILNFFLETVVFESRKRTVKFAKFGSFFKNQSPQRIGRNPKTGEEFNIPCVKKICFYASDKVKKVIN
jgi:integration host factor subunit alpha